MDMSSFPKMLQFKQKAVPHQQLLRWSEWFSKYDFESFYLKGEKNTLADMLSRNPIKEIHMMASSSKSEDGYFDFKANMPKDVHQLIESKSLHEHLLQKVFHYQSIVLSKNGINCRYIAPMGIHPEYPFAHLYRIENSNMPEEVLCFLWYLCSAYTIGIVFDIAWLYQHINAQQGQRECFSTFLTWFAPLSSWTGKLRKSAKVTNLPFKKLKGQGNQRNLNPFFNPHTLYFFHRPVQVNNKSGKLHALPTLIHHNDYQRGIRPDFNIHDNKPYEDFQKQAFRLNNARQTFPIPFNPNWTYYTIDYQMSLDEDLQYFMEKHQSMARTLQAIKDVPISAYETGNYIEDSQFPDDGEDMNIDEIGKRFNIDVSTQDNFEDFEEPEVKYKCPGDEPGCCEKHIIKFEMEH